MTSDSNEIVISLRPQPTVRLSFGLVMLTASLLLLGQFLGVAPEKKASELHARKVISESLAVQISTAIIHEQLAAIEDILRSVTERNEHVLSAALRSADGKIVAQSGDHDKFWKLKQGERSSADQISVPIYNHDDRWGTVELSLLPIDSLKSGSFFYNSFYGLLLFVALAGFLLYLFFLKRALRELNPDTVIPDRVRNALDTLVEGLLVLDKKEFIIFSNTAFAEKIALKPAALTGKNICDLDWEMPSNGDDSRDERFPWNKVLECEKLDAPVQLRLVTELKEHYTFRVNASPINGPGDDIRGALVTFDDITEIERKNSELEQTLGHLKQSQQEISRQNQELQLLATRDPLTNCMNRRSFFAGFEVLFREAKDQGEELCCIMADIDHFKSINDRFGHATGDKVIKLVATILTKTVRPSDLVGRYGGEEFCVVLQGADISYALSVAERMRSALLEGNDIDFSSAVRITASFGVSSLSDGARDPGELVNQADQALYVAKENGRNRVIRWSSQVHSSRGDNYKHQPTKSDVTKGNIAGKPTAGSLKLVESNQGVSGREVELAHLRQQVQQLEQALMESRHALTSKMYCEESTGLPNPLLLFDRISQSIERSRRNNTKTILMVLNIENLQRLNDTLGITVSEKIIKTVANMLKQMLRSTDTVSVIVEASSPSVLRIGNDRLALLFTDLRQIEYMTRIVERIFQRLENSLTIDGNEIYLKANVGLSIFPDDGHTADALLQHANSAMRDARQSSGRNSYTFYSDAIDKKLKYQVRLENELFKAIEKEQLLLYYQPKIDLRTGNITGMEALVRWKHPRLGLVPPNDFIPLAERSGIIHSIGYWVVRTACLQNRMWRKKGYGDISIAVNLSSIQFQSKDFSSKLLNLVKESGVPPESLELEITESVVMQNVDSAVRTMNEFSNAGIRISLDDFGTGYSSLSCLKRFPVNKLKIDRTFITDIVNNTADASLVSSIIAMAHGMGLSVIAEGVETDSQLHFLQGLNCDEIQGYLISRPVPRQDSEKLFNNAADIRQKIRTGQNNPLVMPTGLNLASAPAMAGILNEAELDPVQVL